MDSGEKNQLRKLLRHRRRTLNVARQQSAAKKLAQQLFRIQRLRHAKRIALYIENDGEISPEVFQKASHARGKEIYWPCLQKNSSLSFRPFLGKQHCRVNRFGILEPKPNLPGILPADIDVICLPLVGFDRHGGRLGMGGGFYDRTLEELMGKQRRPLLLGLAHSTQEVERLPLEAWDVPLDGVVTEREIIWTRSVGFPTPHRLI